MECMVLQVSRGFSNAILYSLMVRKGAALCDPLVVVSQDTLHVNPPIVNATAGPLRLCLAIGQSLLYCRQRSSVRWARCKQAFLHGCGYPIAWHLYRFNYSGLVLNCSGPHSGSFAVAPWFSLKPRYTVLLCMCSTVRSFVKQRIRRRQDRCW